MTDNSIDQNASGFTINDSEGSGFVTDQGALEGSGFLTAQDSQQNSGSGFVTEPDNQQLSGSGFVTEPEKPRISAKPAQTAAQPANGISSTFTDIRELSSQGAMSTVYQGKKYGKWHIIKRIKPQFKNNQQYRELFIKEFDNGIQLDHPNIVRFEDKGEDAEGLWYTMEYVDGRSLSDMIKSHAFEGDRNVLQQKLIKSITLQLCDALTYVHKKQIIHRDLKPDNIMVTYRGDNVKVLDFGLAYADSYDDKMVKVGTPKYAAPEQMTKGNLVDQRADIYALGLILLEMCTGTTDFKTIKNIQNVNFQTVIIRCTKQNPQDRYHDCQEITDDLNRHIVKLEEDLPDVKQESKAPEPQPAATPVAKPEPPIAKAVDNPAPVPEKKSKGPLIGIIAAVVVAGIVAAVLLGRGDKNTETSETEQTSTPATEQPADNSNQNTGEQQLNNDLNNIADQIKNEQDSQVKELEQQADKLFYDDKNIGKAKAIYDQILGIDPGYQKAKEKSDNCQKILDQANLFDSQLTQGPNGKYGFVDNEGNIILDYEFDKSKIADARCPQLIAVSKDGKWGILDSKTKLPATEFKYFKAMGLKKNGCQGWELYNETTVPRTKSDYIYVDHNGKTVFIDHENK